MSLDQFSAALAGMLTTGQLILTQRGPSPARTAARRPGGRSVEPCPTTKPHDALRGHAPDRSWKRCCLSAAPTTSRLASKQVAALMRGVRPAEIDALVRELNEDYQQREIVLMRSSPKAAGYRLRLRDEFASVRDQFYGKARQARLSQAAIEVLATVAYHAPITADEISRLRGTAVAARSCRNWFGASSCNWNADTRNLARPVTSPRRGFWSCSAWKAWKTCLAVGDLEEHRPEA